MLVSVWDMSTPGPKNRGCCENGADSWPMNTTAALVHISAGNTGAAGNGFIATFTACSVTQPLRDVTRMVYVPPWLTTSGLATGTPWKRYSTGVPAGTPESD